MMFGIGVGYDETVNGSPKMIVMVQLDETSRERIDARRFVHRTPRIQAS